MRKKRFLNLCKLLIIAALFACVFSYRIYAEEPKNEGSGTDDTVNTEGTGSGGNDSSGNGNGNQGEGSGPFSNGNGNQNEGTDPSGNAGTGNGPAAPASTTLAGTGTDSVTPGSNEDNGEGNGQNGNGGDAPKSPTVKEAGDFLVTGPEDNYTYENGVLTITGDVSVRNKDGVDTTSDRIVIAEDAKVTLEGVNIVATDSAAAIKILAGVTTTFTLANKNSVTGGDYYAGIEVGYDYDPNVEEGKRTVLATLTINGNGELKAVGGSASAGIGASYSNHSSIQNTTIAAYCGNIIIDSGTIDAVGTGGGAGIGSANNNRKHSDGTTSFSASYKMKYEQLGYITINNGEISAESTGSGAGIGGGSHTDSGLITINDGHIIKAIGGSGGGAGIGTGIGSQQTEENPVFSKGPGHYFTEIVINGGTIDEASSAWLGAGIGGGYACDAIITIKGGKIKKAIGGNGNAGANYQGAPGIGAGYMGLPVLTITGGEMNCYGGTGAPGLGYGPGSMELPEGAVWGPKINGYDCKKFRGPESHLKYEDAIIDISGGTIYAQGGINGAGIGSGNGDEQVKIRISGGDITAIGYGGEPENMIYGGAGIGSGTGLEGGATKYQANTIVDIEITGGNVLAIGGWGASGIGSGAENTIAETITIDAEKANVVAYADGTKFAIDTRVVDSEGKTSSYGQNREVTGYVLQGTLVHNYTPKDEKGKPLTDEHGEEMHQGTEGLNDIRIINDLTNETKQLTDMPEGYRSFATDVSEAGTYTVYTESGTITNGLGRYFAEYDYDVIPDSYWTNRIDQHRLVQYSVESGKISDNFYLYPVKSIVVDKQVKPEEGMEPSDLNTLNTTVYFAIREKSYLVDEHGDYILDENGKRIKDDSDDLYIKTKDANGDPVKWIQSIEIVDGVPQNKVYFTNVEDKTYEIFEVDENGSFLNNGIAYGYLILRNISTIHKGGTDNDGVIEAEIWTDSVTVVNTYGIDNKADLVIRKILPAEYRFDQYTDMTVVFRVQVVKKNNAEEVSYENYVGLTMDADSARWDSGLKAYVYEKKLKDVPFNPLTDEFNVEEVYTAGYKAGDIRLMLTDDENKYYRVDTVNTVKDYIPTTGAVNSYSNKTYVPKAVEEGGE